MQLLLVNLNNQQQYQKDIQNLNGIAVISQNEILVALANKYYTIYLWNYEKSITTEITLFQKQSIQNLQFINDDNELVCCQKETICIFSVQKDFQLKLKNIWQIESCQNYTFCPKHLSVLCYNNSWKQDIWCGYKRISFLNPGQSMILIDEQQKPLKFSSNQDGNYIVQLNQQGFIIWDWKNEKQILNSDQWSGNNAMLIDLKILVIANEEEINILDIKELHNIKLLSSLSFDQPIQNISFASNQEYFVCGFDTKIKLWKLLKDGQCQQVAVYDIKYNGKTNPVISPNGKFIVYKAQESYQIIRIKQLHTLELNDQSVFGLVYSSDFQNLITLINGHPILLTPTLEIIESQLEGVIKDNEAKSIVSASVDSIFAILYDAFILIVKIIDQKKLIVIRQISSEGFRDCITISINHFGTQLIVGNPSGSIYFLDLTDSNDEELNKFEQHLKIENQNDQVNWFAFSLNGTDIAAAIYDGSINLYSVEQIENDQNIKHNEENQEQQNQLSESIKKEFRLICYKSFSRQSLLLANQCMVKDSKITQNGKSIIQLFRQKGARE
ncbi:unnamed protein product (macronuclear) [Paramecium tetraurelia]|uniref:Anaphase-promoting complex subunit 4 WD40 domain-containing protein n=1 Tax=Paramecium tetraurelia TaxID=5888 RepID=A0CUP7_PARTE|nr:uncharacterized protein GSPATT00010714001 [Paramecium tetraurelia]CAK74514.1 unnamed protein product [Paramecium tetraurelia]|eukprot:XP_001441911.1 hypothetical protein (macronuclear) [Paramecium tetraurelia strain d4-2]